MMSLVLARVRGTATWVVRSQMNINLIDQGSPIYGYMPALQRCQLGCLVCFLACWTWKFEYLFMTSMNHCAIWLPSFFIIFPTLGASPSLWLMSHCVALCYICTVVALFDSSGDVSAVFSSKYIQSSSLVSAVDTGFFESCCIFAKIGKLVA